MTMYSDALGNVSHDTLVRYVRGQLTTSEQNALAALRQKDDTIAFLFELVDALQERAKVETERELPEQSLSFDQLEELLCQYFSGMITSRECQRLLDALLASSVAFERLLAVLPDITPALAMRDLPEASEVEMQDDAQIIERLVRPHMRPGRARGETGEIAIQSTPVRDRLLGWLDDVVVAPVAAFLSAMSRPPYVAISGIAMLALATILTTTLWQSLRSDPLAAYTYDEHEPYEYRGVGFRSSRSPSDVISEIDEFEQKFKAAMAEYTMLRYQQAIEQLQVLRPLAERLSAADDSKETVQLLRDYYFYLGVAHLGLARSRESNIDSKQASNHLTEANLSLEQAKTIADAQDLQQPERELYFLAVTQALMGNHENAISYLKHIGSDSELFEKSRQLMGILSK